MLKFKPLNPKVKGYLEDVFCGVLLLVLVVGLSVLYISYCVFLVWVAIKVWGMLPNWFLKLGLIVALVEALTKPILSMAEGFREGAKGGCKRC